MHSRRALLYMPGDDWKKIAKALTLSVDCICMDMEDGVALNRKAEARATIARALQELDFGASEKLARINAVGSGLEQDDIAAVLPYRPDGIVIPKIESLEQIQWGSVIIESAELANGWPVNSIRMLVGVETAKGILNLKEIASHPTAGRHHLRRRGLRGLHRRDSHGGGHRVVICAAGGRHSLCGLWLAGD